MSSLALLTLVFSSTASAVATITQQPLDVKAAVEWLQTNLANTPSTFAPMAVQSSLGTSSNDHYRVDLPKKGNRIIISGDNHSSGTTFDAPWDVVVDTLNNRLIVLDQLSDELIAVDPATGAHTVLSANFVNGGPTFVVLQAGVLDPDNNRILVTDSGRDALLAVDLTTGDRTIISDGSTGHALTTPRGLALDTANNRVLVVNSLAGGSEIITVDLSTGTRMSIWALGSIDVRDIEIDTAQNRAVLPDVLNNSIWLVDLASGVSSILSSSFQDPVNLVLDRDNNRVLVTDWTFGAVFSVDLETGAKYNLTGTSNTPWTDFSNPRGIALDAANQVVYVTAEGSDDLFRVEIRPSVGDRSVVSGAETGSGGTVATDFGAPKRMVFDPDNNRVLVTDATAGGVFTVDAVSGSRTSYSSNTGVGSGVAFVNPVGIALDPVRNRVLVIDNGLDAIVAIDDVTRTRTIISGSANGTGTNLVSPVHLVHDAVNDVFYVTDPVSGGTTGAVFQVDPLTGNRTIISQLGVQGTGSGFGNIGAIALDAVNDRLLVGDGLNQQVIAISLDVPTLGDRTPFGPVGGDPWGVEVDIISNRLLVANPALDEIYGLDLATGNKTIIADTFSAGDGPNLTFPVELVMDVQRGRALVLDTDLNAMVALDLFDPVFGQDLATTPLPFSSSPTVTYSLVGGGAGQSFAEWNNDGGSVTNPLLTFDGLPIQLTGLPVGEVVNLTFSYINTFGSFKDGTPFISTPVFTMVNAVTAGLGLSTDTLDAAQGGLFFVDAIGDAIAGDISLQINNNATLNILGENDLVMTLRGDLDGIASIQANAAPGTYRGSDETGNTAGGVVDEFLVNPGKTAASAVIVGGLAEETSASLDLHLVLDGLTLQAKRSFTIEVDVLGGTGITAPLDDVAGPEIAAIFTYTDTDGDGLTDDVEVALGTDIYDTDSDEDGISDFDEVNAYGSSYSYDAGFETDPNNPDTDGDSLWDGAELAFGSDPLDSGSVPTSPIRISTDIIGAESNGDSFDSAYSLDGRYVAFESTATNLVSDGNDNNAAADIFLRDIQTSSIIRISSDATGDAGNGSSDNPTISDDGRYVVFESDANNLVPGDNNNHKDVFRYDAQTGTIIRVSTKTGGGQIFGGYSRFASVSYDGNLVAFESISNTVVANDNNFSLDVFLKDIQADTTIRISTDSAGVEGQGHSFLSHSSGVRVVSNDGTLVVFDSYADNLVPGDFGGGGDIFVKNIITGETIIASTGSTGTVIGGNNDSARAEITPDGRYVVFESDHITLVPNASSPRYDIYVKDLATGLTTLVSTDSNGNAPFAADSVSPRISANGRYVAFQSLLPLVSDDINGLDDVYVKDTWSGMTYRLSVDNAGLEGNGFSSLASISADGRYVGFRSAANNLLGVGNDTNGFTDVFRAEIPLDTDGDGLLDSVETNTGTYVNASDTGTDPNNPDSDGDGLNDNVETDTGTFIGLNNTGTDPNNPDTDGDGIYDGAEVTFGTDPLVAGGPLPSPIRVSTASGGAESVSGKFEPAISQFGDFVAFSSTSSDLVPGDNNATTDIFVKNINTGQTTQASTDSAGIHGNAPSQTPDISSDGQRVVFESAASNLVAGDSNGQWDVFLKDTSAGMPGITTLISINNSGGPADNSSDNPVITDDGLFVAFESRASDLIAPGTDLNSVEDIFVRDIAGGTTTRVSTDSAGNEADGASDEIAMTPDAQIVAFRSQATNLDAVLADTNGTWDIFVKNTQTDSTIRVSTDSTGLVEANGPSFNPSISADGRYVVFVSSATNLVPGDTNNQLDIFMKDTQSGSTTRVSVTANGSEANGLSSTPVISDDGRLVSFHSNASNLVSDKTNSWDDVFIKDVLTGVVTRVSVDSAGNEGDGFSSNSDISFDAGFVVFESEANDLVANDSGYKDIFRQKYNAPPYVDMDGDDSSGITGDDYQTGYIVGGAGPVKVVDVDVSIEDPHNTQLSQVEIRLVNPAAGDTLMINGALPNGIGLSISSSDLILLGGSADLADYETALAQVEFEISTFSSDYTPRQISITAMDTDGVRSNAATSTIDVLVNGVDLFMDTSALSNIVEAGNINLDIGVANYGTDAASEVVLSIVLPPDYTFVSATGDGWDCVELNSIVLCSRQSLPSAETSNVTLNLTSDDVSGTLPLSTAVTSSDTDANPGNESAPAKTAVINYAGGGLQSETISFGVLLEGTPSFFPTRFGASVALDGNLLAIGQPDTSYDMGSLRDGTVIVLERGVSTWDNPFTPQYIESPDNVVDYHAFGHAVALQDNILVVGAPGADDTFPAAGRVYIYERSGNSWNLLQPALVPSLSASDDEFGYSLAVDGDLLAIGAPGADVGGTAAGQVYLYQRNLDTGMWEEQQSYASIATQQFTPTAYQPRFGHDVALQDSLLVVGAPHALTQEPDFGDRGQAFWCDLQGTTCNGFTEFINPYTANEDYFGHAVAIDAGTVVIGMRDHPSVPHQSGAVLMYQYDSAVMAFDEYLVASDAVGNEEFGDDIAIQDDVIVIGAPFARNPHPNIPGDTANSGRAYVFHRDGASWIERQSVHNTFAQGSGSYEYQFGTAVALDGSTVAVGGPFTDFTENFQAHGDVRVYTVSSEYKLISPHGDSAETFGMVVETDGTTVAVGGLFYGSMLHEDVCNNAFGCGAVYLYERRGSRWELDAQLTYADAGATDNSEFGTALALSGDTLLVGAPADDTVSAVNSGAAYVFNRTNGTWGLTQKLESQDAETAGDRFGAAVAVDTNQFYGHAVVGAPNDEEVAPNPQAGAAYVFVRDFQALTWGAPQRIVGTDTDAPDEFGTSVDITETHVVVGAPQATVIYNSQDRGAVYAFTINPLQQQIKLGGGQTQESLMGGLAFADARFGQSVAYDDSSERLLAGMPRGDAAFSIRTGNAYSFIGDGIGGWIETGFNLLPINVMTDPVTYDVEAAYGSDVALLGDVALVGAPGEDHAGNDSGLAIIMHGSSAGSVDSWTWGDILTANDALYGDRYGSAVSMGADARVVGAPGAPAGLDTGAVYVYPNYETDVTVPGGVYNSPQSVGFICDGCTMVFYTLSDSLGDTFPGQTGGSADPGTLTWSPATPGPISIGSTQTLRYFALDADGNETALITEVYIIDTYVPSVAITDPQNLEVTGVVPQITGTMNTDAGSSGDSDGGLLAVQVQIIDDATGLYIDLDGQGNFTGLITTPRWLTATVTSPTDWTLIFNTDPFVTTKSYTVRARVIDVALNISDPVTIGFTYYTGTQNFMTLDLNLSATSILNVPGDNPDGDGEIDASVKLTDPGDLDADLYNSAITLTITDPTTPTPVVTNIPLTTNINGQATIQDLGDATQIDFNVEGTWTIQAHFAGSLTRDAASSEPRTLLVGQSAGSAVIVVGRLGPGNEGLESHNKTGKRIYDVLINRGFQAQDIEFYSPDTNRDGVIDSLDGQGCADGDGCNDTVAAGGAPNGIDGVPTLVATPTITGHKNVQAAIEGLAGLSNSNPAPRYVFMVDHGNVDQFLLNNLNGGEIITPANLDSWLDNQEGDLTGDAINKPNVVVLGMCYAGSFLDSVAIDDSNNPSPSSRVVMASSTEWEESFKGTREADDIRVGEFYLEEFVKEAGRGATLKAAFEYATEQTEIFTRKGDLTSPDPVFNDVAAQHPLLEDNRAYSVMQLATNNALDEATGADGELADTLFLGVGPTYATNAVSNPADITAVTDTVFLPAGLDVSPLTLTANDDTSVASAWVEIRAPLTQYLPAGGSVQLDPVLTKSIMNPPVSAESSPPFNDWYTYYTNFALEGKYEVFYFVQDATTDEISPIRRSVVYKNYDGNTPPAAFNLNTPVDEATTATVTMFDWYNSNDGDGVTYTLQIDEVDDPVGNPGVCSFTSLTHIQEELTVSHAYVGQGDGLLDTTDYCWRVLAVDGFGATTLSMPASRTFTTDDGNGYLGYISGTVRDSVTLVGLDGVVVTPSGGSIADYTEDNGSYLIAINPIGTYTLTATLSGYVNSSLPNVPATVKENKGEDILLASNSADTDGDGTPDNVDTDDDNDGISDTDEIAAGSDPLNENSWPNYADADLNADGLINAGDYLIATRISLGLETATPVHFAHGDMYPVGNPDGVINTSDVLLVLKAVMGL